MSTNLFFSSAAPLNQVISSCADAFLYGMLISYEVGSACIRSLGGRQMGM